MMHLSQLPIIVNKQSDNTRRVKMYECICENVTYNSFHNIKTEMFDNMLFKGAKSETVYLLSICYLLNLRNQYRLSPYFSRLHTVLKNVTFSFQKISKSLILYYLHPWIVHYFRDTIMHYSSLYLWLFLEQCSLNILFGNI